MSRFNAASVAKDCGRQNLHQSGTSPPATPSLLGGHSLFQASALQVSSASVVDAPATVYGQRRGFSSALRCLLPSFGGSPQHRQNHASDCGGCHACRNNNCCNFLPSATPPSFLRCCASSVPNANANGRRRVTSLLANGPPARPSFFSRRSPLWCQLRIGCVAISPLPTIPHTL